MEASVPRHRALKLLVTTILMVILLNTSHHGATAFTVSLTKGNDTAAATSICTGTCLVDDQHAELELLMMGSETNRRLQGPITFTGGTGERSRAYTCGRPAPTCRGPATGAPKAENCYADNYNRNCHQYN